MNTMNGVDMDKMREEFEGWLGIKPCGAAHDLAWAAWQAARAQPAEHAMKDKRCKCCGYMTYQREHMGCIRAATAQPDGEAVAWQVRNGVVTHGFYKSQSDAEEVARDMQKSHDLSGSFASFNVRPLYTEPPTPRAQLMRVAVPGIRPNW